MPIFNVFTRKFSEFVGQPVDDGVGLTGGANSIGPNSGGGGASITYTFTQAAVVVPPLYLGAAVRVDVASTLWECCLATTALDAEFYAFIVGIAGDVYTVQFAGVVPAGTPFLTGLVEGTPYYLSDTVPGGISAVPPAIAAEINLPVLWAMDNGNSVIKMSRGFVEGSSGGGGGGGGSPNNVATVTQPGNTFGLGDALYMQSDQTFALANAYTTLAASQAEWVVTGIVTPGSVFTIQQGGRIQGLITTDDVGAAMVSGPTYYISPIAGQEGKLTSVQPSTAGLYSKPFYVQQVAASNTGWLLDQRPSIAVTSNPNASPYIYLGQLDPISPDGSFTDLTILSRNGTFGSYFFIVAALSSVSVGNASLGLQLYGGGVFETTAYTYYLDGMNSTIPGGAQWQDVQQGQPNLTFFPNIGPDPVVVSGYGYLHLFPTFGVDVEWAGFGAPNGGGIGIPGYTVRGQMLCGNATIVTGLRVICSPGVMNNAGYVKIWGIPNS